MTEPDDLEPARRLIDEPTDGQGRLLGWRAKDVGPADLSDDDYAAQFTRHAPDAD
jgi:hypothetical protein